jgi:hypothetical protein
MTLYVAPVLGLLKPLGICRVSQCILCAPRGGVTRQGVVLTDLQSLRDCQKNFSLSLALSLSRLPPLEEAVTFENARSTLLCCHACFFLTMRLLSCPHPFRICLECTPEGAYLSLLCDSGNC